MVNLVVLFAIIDLLFLPRILYPFAIQSSLLVLLIFQVNKKRKFKSIIFYFLFMSLVVLSVINSIHINESELSNNLKRALQILTVFAYLISINELDINKNQIIVTLKIFFIFIALILIFYFMDPFKITKYIITVYPEAVLTFNSVVLNDVQAAAYRFSYIFQDPNSAGYFIVIALALYLSLIENIKKDFFYVIICVIAVASTQSRGAILSLISLLILYSFMNNKNTKGVIIGLGIVFILSFVAFYFLSEYTIVFDNLYERTQNEEQLGGSRLSKYSYFMQNFSLLPYGVGYYLSDNGIEFRPHSDLIRLVISYGFFVLVYIFWLIFPRNKYQLWLFIPFFLAFMVHTIISDYRLFGFYLLAFSIVNNKAKTE